LRKWIAEVKNGNLPGFTMKLLGVHSLPFGGVCGGRTKELLTKGFYFIRSTGRRLQRDVLECPVASVKGNRHPAIYPQALVERLLQHFTRFDDIVLDPFLGSGTTALACRKLGRRFVGIELVPEYVEEARQRLENAPTDAVSTSSEWNHPALSAG
jgi:site-specific DNA-methyltransferase (adenine-specific)